MAPGSFHDAPGRVDLPTLSRGGAAAAMALVTHPRGPATNPPGRAHLRVHYPIARTWRGWKAPQRRRRSVRPGQATGASGRGPTFKLASTHRTWRAWSVCRLDEQRHGVSGQVSHYGSGASWRKRWVKIDPGSSRAPARGAYAPKLADAILLDGTSQAAGH